MKIGVFLVAFLLLSSCSNAQQPELSKPDANKTPPTKSTLVILELITAARGMVYPKEGDILTMRLYKDGRFEYDDWPPQDPPRYLAGKVPITLKESILNPEDVKELIELAEKPDFLSAKEKYPGLHPHVDDTWTVNIRYTYHGHDKKISAVNFWDMKYYKEDRAKYPPSMIKLLERVSELKSKAIKN